MDYIFSNRIKGVDGEAIAEILKASADPSIISLAGGNPASELFPNKELAEIAHDLLLNEPVLTLQYSVAQGYLPLREKIKEILDISKVLVYNDSRKNFIKYLLKENENEKVFCSTYGSLHGSFAFRLR